MLQALESEDLDTAWQRRQDTDEEKNDIDMLCAFSRIYHGTSGHVFLFFILDAKMPKFTYVIFEKTTDIKLRNGGP